MKRVESGVKNFDRLLGGGIPEKQMILLEGEPGCGKSNLGLEFIYRGSLKGENGLYISFQNTSDQILRTTTFDWKFEQKVDEGSINLSKFDPYRHEEIASMLRSRVMENNASRVVLDPITDLDLYIDSRKDQRKNLLEIKEEMRDLGCTTMLIAEKEEATNLEEEVADGIINMEMSRSQGSIERRIFVKKLQGSSFDQGVHNYIINSDGIKIK